MNKRVAVCLVIAAACSKGGGGEAGSGRGARGSGGGRLEYPVEVAPLKVRKMQYTVAAPGSIEAFQQVQITSRVSGAVDKVGFVEGQQVKAGDSLVLIESERYQIAVDQAKNAVSKAQATQRAAEAALARREKAQEASPGLVPGEEIEQKQTAVDTAKSDVEAAKQALRVAQLNLRDSSVRAPIEGTVQTRSVQQGQYLQPGSVLATILQKDPMLLRFQATELDAPRLKPGMTANIRLKESDREFSAKITLVADAADPTTRMVPVTAQLDDTEHKYWLRPGAFCEVTVPVGDARQGIVVPSLAVTPTENGNIVYVVDGAVVHARVVQLGMHTPDGGIELTRGVKEGEVMVMRGVEPLSEGAPIKIAKTLTLEEASAPPANPASAAPGPVKTDEKDVGSGSGSGSGSAK